MPERQRELRVPEVVVRRRGDVHPDQRDDGRGQHERGTTGLGVQVVTKWTSEPRERLPGRRPGIRILMKLMRLALRVLIGGLFVGHGTQKLFGWFGGHGLEGTAGFMESLGLQPGKRNAIAAGAAEAGGGALLATGVAMPLAGAAITGAMTTAITHVHAPKGPWTTEGGWEYNAVLIAATLALVEDYCGLGWALGAGAAGLAGSLATTKLAQKQSVVDEFEPVPFESGEPVQETVST